MTISSCVVADMRNLLFYMILIHLTLILCVSPQYNLSEMDCFNSCPPANLQLCA